MLTKRAAQDIYQGRVGVDENLKEEEEESRERWVGRGSLSGQPEEEKLTRILPEIIRRWSKR